MNNVEFKVDVEPKDDYGKAKKLLYETDIAIGNLPPQDRDNLLAEVDKSLYDFAKDFNEVSNHPYENKEEILVALSNATNHLNELKDRLQTMAV